MVLTPHLTGEQDDGRKPGERDILRAGCYNLGFLALSRHPHLENFLRWWQKRLEFGCQVDFAEGLFVDQKWIDLAPGLFEGVSVLRHPGYNVAYWNLAHRNLEQHGGDFLVNALPLAFYHFSGLNLDVPGTLSKHQDRFRLEDVPAVGELVRHYRRAVIR